MVVHVTRRAYAVRLLEGNYFDVNEESAFTRVFEPRCGRMQGFKCLGPWTQGLFLHGSTIVWKVRSVRTPPQ